MGEAPEQYLTTTEAAAVRRRKPQTLRKERWRGEGPPFIRDGGRVLYPRKALERWLAERMVA